MALCGRVEHLHDLLLCSECAQSLALSLPDPLPVVLVPTHTLVLGKVGAGINLYTDRAQRKLYRAIDDNWWGGRCR